jgi:DNA-binding phage protein
MKKANTKAIGKGAVKEGREEKERLHRIKEHLSPAKKEGKTAYWLAKETAISYNTIHKYLNNTMEPSLSNLKKIAAKLGLKGKDLINF